MQTITLNVEDEAVDKVLAWLNNMSNEVNIVSTEKIEPSTAKSKLTAENMAGMFSHYVTHRISDEEIAEAVTAGALKRGMAGKGL